MYLIILALLGMSLALAIGVGFQELRRLHSELEIEKTKLRSPQELQLARTEGEVFQRAQIAETLENQMQDLLTSADEQLLSFHSDGMAFSTIPKVTRILKAVQRQFVDLSDPAAVTDINTHGLGYGLKSMIQRLSTRDLRISFRTNIDEERFPRYVEVYLYQACSEIIQNSLKHSSATSCKVSLDNIGRGLRLTIKDNGRNEIVGAPPVPGFGLTRLKQKCEKYGGSFMFRLSVSGAETEIILPLVSSAMMVMV